MQIKTLRSDGGEYMEGSTSPMIFEIFCESMVYAGSLHADILHSRMELQKGKTCTLQRLHVH